MKEARHRGAHNIHIIIPLSRWLYKALSRLKGNAVETSLGYRASAKPVWVTESDPVSSPPQLHPHPHTGRGRYRETWLMSLAIPASPPRSHSHVPQLSNAFTFHLLLFFMVVFLTHSSALLSGGFLRNCLDLFGFYFTKNKSGRCSSECLPCTYPRFCWILKGLL